MVRVGVKSSNIVGVGWEASKTSRGTLEIQFHNGAVYSYPDVPEYVFKDMLKSPSIGQYFRQVFEPNVRTYRRLS